MSYEDTELVVEYSFTFPSEVKVEIEGVKRVFPKGSLQASIHLELLERGFTPVYKWSEKFQEPLLIGIPLKGDFLVLVNDKEPGEGTIPLSEVFPRKGIVKILRKTKNSSSS